MKQIKAADEAKTAGQIVTLSHVSPQRAISHFLVHHSSTMTERFYTEQRLNRDLEVHDFQTGAFRYPLDLERLGSLPPALGASTLPPQGAFSTEKDVANLSHIGEAQSQQKPVGLVSPLYAALALVAAYMLFLPMAY